MAALLAAALVGTFLLVRARSPGPLPPPSASPSPPASQEAPLPDDRTPEIRGRILDADGVPVAGAAVRLVSPRPPFTVFRETKSDGVGRFSFPRVHAERVRVVGDHDPEGVVSSAELHAAEGTITEVTLVLSAASAVRGTVVDRDGHPVPGAVVGVEGVPWTVRSVTSDEQGAFRLSTVPDEAATLVAVARGYKTARVPLARSDGHAELVVRVQLAAAPPVEGDVRDVDGNPVRARIVACEGQPAEARATSAEDGTFELPPSAIGCDAVAQHDEYGPSDPVAVLEGRRVALRLRPGGAIEGVVVDDRGVAVPSFLLGIESFSASGVRSFRSGGRLRVEDPRGAFRWEKLAPGSYVLTASAPGRSLARSRSIDVAGGAVIRGVRIVLLQGGTLMGHVYDERHAPLAGADLRFDAVSSILDSSADAKTDAAGQYRLDGAPSGPFTVRVEKDGFRLRLLSGLRVDPGGVLTEDVTLTPFDGGAGLELGGIGASLDQTREGIFFRALFPGDPGERAGLRAGDRLLRIDGEDTDGMSISDVLQRLRGVAGTSVGVSVQRPDTRDTIDVMVVRAAIVR